MQNFSFDMLIIAMFIVSIANDYINTKKQMKENPGILKKYGKTYNLRDPEGYYEFKRKSRVTDIAVAVVFIGLILLQDYVFKSKASGIAVYSALVICVVGYGIYITKKENSFM